MFTGIIEALGTIASVRERAGAREFEIRAPEVASSLQPGASVAVDGACQTSVRNDETSFVIETIGTTLSRTIAGRYRVGTKVNLERPLALGGRLDGHLVQGHVDGVGRLMQVRREGDYWLMDFEIPEGIGRQTILHGSIALNGVSLTVNALPSPTHCQVGIIPFTWEHTNLGALQSGDPVNVEGDLVGKYIARLMEGGGTSPTLTWQRLASMGYGGDEG